MKYIRYILVVSVIFFLLYLGFKDVSFSEMLSALGRVDLLAPLIFIIGTVLHYFIRAYRWGILLKPYKKKIPIKTLYNYTVIGFMLNLFPGRVGELARAFLLSREEKIENGVGLASVFLERLIDFLIIVLFFLFSLQFIGETNSSFLISMKQNSLSFLMVVAGIFTVLLLLNFKLFFDWVCKVIRFVTRIIPERYREKISVFLIEFAGGLRFRLGFLDTLKLIGASILVWLFQIPFFWILLKGFDIGITIGQTVTHFGLIVASAAIPTPGMAGTFDASSIKSLTEILGPSVKDSAAAYTVLLHVMILAVQIVLGLIAFKMQKLNFKLVKELKEKK